MQNLILLHGAIGAASQLQPLKQLLEHEYRVFVPDLAGHGGKAFPAEGFSIRTFAEDVITFMDDNMLDSANFFGYSMGGYVAMYLARHYPDRVGRVVTLATKFNWDAAIAAKEVQMLDAAKIEAKLPAFAAALQERHAPNDWKDVLSRTAAMLEGLGANNTLKPEDYKEIQAKALILSGDRDKMITFEETVNVYKVLREAQMGILPGTQHPIEQVNPDMLCFLMKQFLGED